MPVPTTNAPNRCRRSAEETVVSAKIYLFPVERIKSPARKFDEPATIYSLANERMKRGLAPVEAEAAHAKGRR
jgi:hypothetical protein